MSVIMIAAIRNQISIVAAHVRICRALRARSSYIRDMRTSDSLSVPAIYFFAVFKNRVAKISVDTLLAADELVRRIVQQAKSKGASSTAVEPPVPGRV